MQSEVLTSPGDEAMSSVPRGLRCFAMTNLISALKPGQPVPFFPFLWIALVKVKKQTLSYTQVFPRRQNTQ